MLQLTHEEQAWLDAYRKALDKKHPGTVEEILVYGSKARGQAHAESDLDVLLKNEQSWALEAGVILSTRVDPHTLLLRNGLRFCPCFQPV